LIINFLGKIFLYKKRWFYHRKTSFFTGKNPLDEGHLEKKNEKSGAVAAPA
jgi:hypothetical protein